MTSTPSPLFILAAPRSYSSVICAMLGCHPGLYGLPEINLLLGDRLSDVWQRTDGYGSIHRHGLLRAAAQLFVGAQTVGTIGMANQWVMARMNQDTVAIYRELCAAAAPRRVVDKSPIYTSDIENLYRLERAFPDALYLHLVRHPRTQCDSFMSLPVAKIVAKELEKDEPEELPSDLVDSTSTPPCLDPQIDWHNRHRRVLTFLADIPESRKRLCRAEDVLVNPGAELRAIVEWLGLEFSPAILERMVRPEESEFARPGPRGAMLGMDRKFLENPRLDPTRVRPTTLEGPLPWRPDGRGFHSCVVQLAKELGYEGDGAAGEEYEVRAELELADGHA